MIQWDWWKCFIGWFVTEPVMKTETTGLDTAAVRKQGGKVVHVSHVNGYMYIYTDI